MAAYLYTRRQLRGAAVGLFSLLRNEGGSVGTSMAQTMQERRDQFHTLRLGEYLDPFNPAVNSFLEQARGVFLQQTGDPAAVAAAGLAGARESAPAAGLVTGLLRLSSGLFAVVTLALVLVVLLMKRSVAEKGAHIGSE